MHEMKLDISEKFTKKISLCAVLNSKLIKMLNFGSPGTPKDAKITQSFKVDLLPH